MQYFYPHMNINKLGIKIVFSEKEKNSLDF